MKEKKKEKMELTQKTPETANPFGMMRRFTKDMERLFNDFEEFRFPNFFGPGRFRGKHFGFDRRNAKAREVACK